MSVCFYCKDPKISVCVCLDCKFKIDVLKRDLAEARRDLERAKELNRGLKASMRRIARARLRNRPK